MKLVIDIPEEEYKCVQITGCIVNKTWISNAIYNGTPLPKSHGRLIDYGYVVDAIDDWINAEEYRYTNGTDYLRNRIENVQAIIEEDKGEVRNKE